jgi:titin
VAGGAVSGGQLSLNISNLRPGTQYWLRVRGENGGSTGQDIQFMTLNWGTTSFVTPEAEVSDAPTSLQVSEVRANSFALAWTAPAYSGGRDITNFSVEVSTDNGVTWRNAKADVSTSLSLTISGAAPATRYLIRIAAVNAVGASSYLTGEVTTLPTVPTAPTSLAVSSITATSLTLSWQIPTSNGGVPITNYQIEFSSDGGTSWTVIDRVPSNDLAFNVSSLRPNQDYQFRVSAVNGGGTGPTSNIASATTLVTPPSVPTDFSASGITASAAALSWSAPTNWGGAQITDFQVETSRDGGVNWRVVQKRVSTSTRLTLTGLAPGTTYQVRVAALNSSGLSLPATGTFTTQVAPPSAPTNLRAVDVTSTTAVIAWSLPVSNGGRAILNYRVEVSSNCTNYTALPRTVSKALAQSVIHLRPGTRYCFRVSTITDAGTSPASTVLTLVTLDNLPSAPTGLSFVPATTQATLSWQAATMSDSSPVRNYLVEYSRDAGNTWNYVSKPVSTSTSLTISGFAQSTNYLFRVYAVNNVGASLPSTNLAVMTAS